jgi:hypothetical protein
MFCAARATQNEGARLREMSLLLHRKLAGPAKQRVS